MSGRILVLGSINLDYAAVVERLPGPGVTVPGGELMIAYGGKGANQAVAARRAGAEVCLAGCVGDDPGGQGYVAAMRAEGIDTSHIRTVAGAPTGTALILVDGGSGENMIAVCPGANGAVGPADVDGLADELAAAQVVVAQLELPLEAVMQAARAARQAGVSFLLNPSPMPPEGLPGELLECVTHLVCNEAEAATLGVLKGGPGNVIVTRGARGCEVCEAGQCTEVAPYSVAAVDTVGAGDAFAGAFAAALAEGGSCVEAARFGNAAGALAATVRGAMPSLPAREQILRLMSR